MQHTRSNAQDFFLLEKKGRRGVRGDVSFFSSQNEGNPLYNYYYKKKTSKIL
jgi:hypothetical protein